VGDRPRRLSWHHPIDPADRLRQASAYAERNAVGSDRYGEGGFLAGFEAKIARELGMEAGLFLATGGLAQLIAARVWCESRGRSNLALHPRSHIALREGRGFERVNRLSPLWLGDESRPLTLEQIADCDAGCLLYELPLRSLGGALPSWEEWRAIQEWAQASATPLHLDGARIWEAAAAYRREVAELCQGTSSVYVSFYKGIGSTTGALLAGSREFIAAAREWQPRFGARIVEAYPLAVPAAQCYEQRRHLFASYHARAIRLAEVLGKLGEIRLFPDPPHTNMFHVYFQVAPERMSIARDRVAESTGIWLFDFFAPGLDLGTCYGEVVIGDASSDLSDQEIEDSFLDLIRYTT